MIQVLRDRRGFTLAELLVVTAIVGLIMAALMLVYQQGQTAYLMGSSRVEAQQNARVALDLMARELRSARLTGIPSATSVSFNDPTGVAMTYALSGSDLVRTAGGTSTTLIGGVQALSMTYCRVWSFTGNSCTTAAQTSNPGETEVILIDLTTKPEDGAVAGTAGDRRARMRSLVQLRNQ